VTIRRATIADSDGILDCLRLAFEPYRERYSPAAYADTVMSADTIERRLSAMVVLVANDPSGAIVGTIGYSMMDHVEGHLRGMAVAPDRHGTGVGQRLLDRAERDLKQLGCSRITLDTTEPLDRATRFYERNGFRATGVERDFFGMRLIEYAKSLRP